MVGIEEAFAGFAGVLPAVLEAGEAALIKLHGASG